MFGMSVTVPYRNRFKCLDRCLRPLLRQKTNFPFEVVFVDYGSTDDTLSYLCKSYSAEIASNKLVLVHYPADAFNLAGARNVGIAFSNYPLIFTFDIDSICLSDTILQEVYDFYLDMEQKAKKNIQDLEQYKPPLLTKNIPYTYDEYKYIPYGHIVRTVGWGNCLLHKDIFFAIGGLDHMTFRGKGYEDMAFMVLCLRNGYYLVQYPDVLYRKKNTKLVNFKDHELSPEERVETYDVWEDGCDAGARERSYRRFRLLVESPGVRYNSVVDWNLLRKEGYRINI